VATVVVDQEFGFALGEGGDDGGSHGGRVILGPGQFADL
jgi:hypothetical protein